MLQIALFLLCCALSRYLWGIDKTVASVVLSVTTFGAIFYIFLVVAGTASASCPYQTPGARILRYLWRKVPSRAHAWLQTSFPTKNSSVRHPSPEQKLDREVTALDFGCASWMLQTSLDRGINDLTLKFLGSVLALPGFEVKIVTDCFNILASCVGITDNRRVVAIRGSEQLAARAATCLLGSISHSLAVDPASNILKDVYQRHQKIFPPAVDLKSLPFYHTIRAIRRLFNKYDHPETLDWKGIDFSTSENLFLAHYLTKIAWLWYQKSLSGVQKVPRWVLRFSLHSLLSGHEPPASVIADCLMIIAIDLGCDVSEDDIRSLDKRYAYLTQPHSLLS